MKLHTDNHGGNPACIDVVAFSTDGVKESKSGKTSLNVFSLRFSGCRLVYPVVIQRPVHMDGKRESRRALEELVQQFK